MLEQVTIHIINNTGDDEEDGRVHYHSFPLDYRGRMISAEQLVPAIPGVPFFAEGSADQDPIEFLEGPAPGTSGSAPPLSITIDPGYSFGDGRHATTWLCVKFLVEHLSGISPGDRGRHSLLDAGTGTGVLSIIAARFGITDIDAVDIYHHAIQCAAGNCAANDCRCIRLHESDLATFSPGRRYDIITANLVTSVIIANVGMLAAHLKPGGVIIASGVSSGNDETVRHHFRSAGLSVADAVLRDGWFGYLLKGGGEPG